MTVKDILEELLSHYSKEAIYTGNAYIYVPDIAPGDENNVVRRRLKAFFESGVINKISTSTCNDVFTPIKRIYRLGEQCCGFVIKRCVYGIGERV